MDCCCANNGYNKQKGCTQYYCAANSVLGYMLHLVGKVLWTNLPFAIAGEVLETIIEAWKLDPINTRATIVIPE